MLSAGRALSSTNTLFCPLAIKARGYFYECNMVVLRYAGRNYDALLRSLMDYLDLKMALAEAAAEEQWQRCVHLTILLASCRPWPEEEQLMWAKKLARYQVLATLDG